MGKDGSKGAEKMKEYQSFGQMVQFIRERFSSKKFSKYLTWFLIGTNSLSMIEKKSKTSKIINIVELCSICDALVSLK